MHPLQWICLSILFGAFAALMWFVLGGPTRRRTRLFRDLASFQRALERCLAAGLAPVGMAFSGALASGRRARVTLQLATNVTRRRRSAQQREVTAQAGPRVRATVSTSRQAPKLRLRQEGLGAALRRAFSRDHVRPADLAGQAGREDSFTPAGGAAGRRHRDLDAGLRAALDEELAGLGVDQLALRPGELVAEAPLEACPPERFEALLAALDRAARQADATLIPVTVLAAERWAAVAPDGGVRCVYCRDGLTGAEPDLVACERCQTAIHGACWDEHGRCPVLGCDGDKAERSRARA